MAPVIGNAEGRSLDREVRFAVLGPVTVTEGTTTLNIGGPKQRTVLAMLIAHAGHPVSADSIIEAVWGEEAAPNARRTVQTYIATLRGALGDVIVKVGSGWRLSVDRDQVDSIAFESLYLSAREIQESNPQRASVALREALAMWRGHPYADIDAWGTLEGEIVRLSELRVAAQAARIDADLSLGRDADLVGEIEALIAEHPLSERFRALHMVALYRAGRQQEALRSYEEMRSTLVEELGVDPTPDLQDLERRILDHDDSLRVKPTQTIQRRAILVADPGDSIEIGHLPPSVREGLLTSTSYAIKQAVARAGDCQVITAGTTTYLVFDDVLAAAAVADSVTRRLDGDGMRIAIDWGDMVLENGRVSGPPVSRAAVMAAVAHRGQVLLSPEAQSAIASSSEGRGLRFENLGSYDLHGVEGTVLVYQLLVGDMPAVFPDLETHRLPPPLPGGADRSVPGYELREAIGPGSTGTLHRAFQPSVGREVLIEVIDRAQASGTEFVRDFEADAQRLSLLDHQGVAQVIDYWRHPDGAYLVYRYPRGGLLSQVSAPDAARTIDQLGSALAYAHSFGMVHGSLRPDRVAFDEAGNASILCFPVAGFDPSAVDEYREFVAPELRAGERATAAGDLYSLAVLARSMGLDHPAVARASDDDPGRRHSSVAEFLVELNPTDAPSPAERYTQSRNPYKGLAPFHEKDSGDFFGRTAAVEELCGMIERSSLLAIVGPSGIGKSSVARAGLVPALRRGAVEGSESWLITDMFPGPHPFFELQRALEGVAVQLPVELTEGLAEFRPDSLRTVGNALPDQRPLVVLIDQFEELFTMVSERERRSFLDLMDDAAGDGTVRFVITLRADFLDRPLRYSRFGATLRESSFMLAAPNEKEIAEAITRPADGVGVRVAPELVERMVSEVHDQPGALPLLQHTLAELFKARTSDLIDLTDYEATGGVRGSLAQRAESIYAGLADTERTAVQQVFLRLVTVVDGGAPTRRRARLVDLEDLEARDSIQTFARSRLLVLDTDPETRSPTVEVAHEALLSHWPRLAGWIDTAREDLGLARRLDESRREWENNGREDAYLLSGGRLHQHEAWTATTALVLAQSDRDYLNASHDHDRKLRSRARRRRSLVTAGFGVAALVALVFALNASDHARRADAEQLAATAVLAADTDPELALLLATQAFQQSPSPAAESALHQGLQGQRGILEVRSPPGATDSLAAVDPAGELMAVVGYGTSSIQMWDIATGQPLWNRVISEHPDSIVEWLSSIWFSSDGDSVFVPLSPPIMQVKNGPDSPGAGLYELDAHTGETKRFVRFPCLFRATPAGTQFADGSLWAIDFLGIQPDGSCNALGGIGVLDFDSGELVYSEQVEPGVDPNLSADGRYMAVDAWFWSGGPYANLDDVPKEAQGSGLSVVIDTATGERLRPFEDGGGVQLSPDGRRALVTNGGQSYLFDVETGERLQTYQAGYLRARFVGESLLAMAEEGSVRIFDIPTGEELSSLKGHAGGLRRVSFNEDGRVAVTSGLETARVWDSDLSLRSDLEPIELPEYRIVPAYGDEESGFDLDALSGVDGVLLARRVSIGEYGGPVPQIPYRADLVDSLDGEHLWSREVWALEIGPGNIAVQQPILEFNVEAPSGLAGSIRVGLPELVEGRTGRHIRYLEGCIHYWVPSSDAQFFDESEPGCEHEVSFNFVNFDFSADGSHVSGSTALGEVIVWNLGSGKIVRMDGPTMVLPRFRLEGYRWTAALSPDGSEYIVPPDPGEWEVAAVSEESPSMVVRNVSSNQEVGRFDAVEWIDFLTYVPQIGKVVGADAGLVIVDSETWELERLDRTQGAVIADMDISPDGTLAATVALDNHLVVWDLVDRRIISDFPVLGRADGDLHGVAFVDDETIAVATDAENGRLLMFTVDSDRLLSLAGDSLTRGFRPEECATYDIDPCPTLEEMKSR